MKQVCSITAVTATIHRRSKPNISIIGRKIGNTIITMPNQSRNMPIKNTIAIMIANAPHLPMPTLEIQVAISWSPSSDMKMPVKADAPNRMMNTIADVFAVSISESYSIFQLNCL